MALPLPVLGTVKALLVTGVVTAAFLVGAVVVEVVHDDAVRAVQVDSVGLTSTAGTIDQYRSAAGEAPADGPLLCQAFSSDPTTSPWDDPNCQNAVAALQKHQRRADWTASWRKRLFVFTGIVGLVFAYGLLTRFLRREPDAPASTTAADAAPTPAVGVEPEQ